MTEDDFEERRHNPPHTLAEAIQIIESRVDERIVMHLEKHNAQEQARQEAILAEMRSGNEELRKLILAGFPDSDPAGHRKHHEESIEFYKDMKDLAKEVRNHTVKGVIWAALILVGLSLWQFTKTKIGQP